MEVEFKARNTVIEKFNLDVKACMVIAWTWNDDGNISSAQVTGEANNVVDPTNIRDAVCKIGNPEVQRTNG